MAAAKRHDGRRVDQLRPVRITPGFVGGADGSCLIETGRTRVICTASFCKGVPRWRKGSGLGWLTAEYGMLPASTGARKPRPAGKGDSRGIEIQRMIGRALRNVVRLDRLGENTIYLDCDVLEADGGTRTTSVTGAQVALSLAVARGARSGACGRSAVVGRVAAVSAGIVDGRALLDLDYAEDSRAQVDINVAMLRGGKFVDLQGTAERTPFTGEQLRRMLALARRGAAALFRIQTQAIRNGMK